MWAGIRYYADTPVFKAASPLFCLFTVFGAIVFAVSAIVFGLAGASPDWIGDEPSGARNVACQVCRVGASGFAESKEWRTQARPWLICFAFVWLTVPLILKRFRVNRVFQDGGLNVSPRVAAALI